MKKRLLVCIAIALAVAYVPFGGFSSIKTVRADGTLTQFTKGVDIAAPVDYLDEGQTVFLGTTLSYQINWAFTPGTLDFTGGYIYDTVPAGTSYINPSASPTSTVTNPDAIQYFNGAVWVNGEPPNMSAAGTQFRWKLPTVMTGWTGAGTSVWNRVQNYSGQPMDIDVSRTNQPPDMPAAISEVWYDMKYDSNGYPCIVWQDNGDPRSATPAEPNIYFVRWNGTGWICQNNAPYVPNTPYPNANAKVPTPSNITQTRHPRLALDSVGSPHIVFDAWRPSFGGEYDIHFVHWEPSSNNWINNTGGSPSSQSFVYARREWSLYPQIEMDSSNAAIISWFEETGAGTGQYSIFTCRIAHSGGGETDLLGGNNIANYAIQRTNGTAIGTTFNMTLDSSGRPHIAFENGAIAEIYYVRWSGAPTYDWRTISNSVYSLAMGNLANVSVTAPDDSATPWIKLSSTGQPRITWCETRISPPETVICYIAWNSSLGRWENANGTIYTSGSLSSRICLGDRPSMDLDRNGFPCIAFNGGFVRWDGGQWVNGNNNPIATTNTTDGTGSLNPYAAPFNPIDVILANNLDRIGISTSLVGNPASTYDVAFIQKTITAPLSGVFRFNVLATSPVPSVCNTATFDHDNGPVPAPATNTVCNPETEVSISKSAVKYDYMKDDIIEFDILVNNPTGGMVNSVVITDTIPANLIYYASSVVPTTITATTITFVYPNLGPGLLNIHLAFTLDPNYQFNNVPLVTTNTASVTCAQFPVPKTDSASVRINETAFLFVKTAGKSKYKPNEIVSFDLEIENLGTTPFYGVSIVDQIPVELIFDSISPEVGTLVNDEYRIWIGDLLPGESRFYTLYFKINKDFVRQGVNDGLSFFDVTNNATAMRDGYEDSYSKDTIRVILPKLAVSKTARKFQMTPQETVTFTIYAKNVSEVETTNTVLYDIFPEELIYNSALPTGVVKPGKIVYDLGTFMPGEVQKFDITFSVKNLETWPDNGIAVINTAILTCDELDNVIDHAMLLISPKRTSDPLQLVCKWINLDVKTGIVENGDLKLELNAVGGTSPYEFYIDWGDGQKSMDVSTGESEIVKMDHKYEKGEYDIVIKCIDRGTRTKFLRRKIKVE